MFHRQNAASLRLADIPAVGPVGAVMLTLKTPDPRAFKSGRDFAAWLGLTPKDHSTAGKQRLGRSPRRAMKRCAPSWSAGRCRCSRSAGPAGGGHGRGWRP